MIEHPKMKIGDDIILDATTEEMYISFPMQADSKKQSVYAKGRDRLLKAGLQKKKFRFSDDIRFHRMIINGVREAVVTVKLKYTGTWTGVTWEMV